MSRKKSLVVGPSLWIALVLALMAFSAVNWPGGVAQPKIAAADNTVTVELAQNGESAGINFSPTNVSFDPPSCNVVIGTGDVCTDLLTVQNTGIEFTYTISAWVDSNPTDDGPAGPAGDALMDCFNVHLTRDLSPGQPVGNASSQGPFAPLVLDAGDEDVWRLDANLDDDNTCQGLTGTLFIYVSAVGIAADVAPSLQESTPAPSPTAIPTTVPTSVPTAATPPEATTTGLTGPATDRTSEVQALVETPTPAVTPAFTPTPVPNVQAAVPSPSPEPTQEVAPARVVLEPRTFLNEVPGLSSVSTSLAVIGTNLFLALIALLILLLATTMFNATMKENAAEIDAVVKQVSNAPHFGAIAGALGWLSPEETRSHLLLSRLKPGLIVILTAAIYAALDPDFGFNNETLVLLIALVAGIASVTFLYEGGQVLWSTRRIATPAAMRLYPLAILIAVGCVLLTKLTDLHPGIIFGFVTAAAIFPRTALSKRQQGLLVAVPLVGLMLVSLAAFLLIDPLRDFSQNNPGVWATLPETIAVALFVGGAESALLILIPFTFNDGEKIWAWNKGLWFVLAVPATFAFFHALINEEDLGSLAQDTDTLRLILICLGVLAISVATWLYFWFRRRSLA